MRPEISVIIASRNRAPLLEALLHALAAQQDAPAWEAVVVDNGSSDGTPALLARMARDLPVVSLCEPRAGKSRALNRALEAVNGEFVIFTDDDVRPSSRWVAELYAASRTYRHGDVFCGPIVPEFPADTPAWLRGHRFAGPAFAAFSPNLPAGRLPEPLLPFGPNFAITRPALSGMSFRLDLGPSDRGNLMCEDTEFLEELRRRSKQFIFVPTASVVHRIRPELTEVASLFERAFALGRSEIIRGKLPDLPGSEPLPPQRVEEPFELGCVLSFVCGQLCELDAQGLRERGALLTDWIAASSWRGAPGSIARSAEEWLHRRPELRPVSVP